eukprot:767878-Hanusia_phi.AAC.1
MKRFVRVKKAAIRAGEFAASNSTLGISHLLRTIGDERGDKESRSVLGLWNRSKRLRVMQDIIVINGHSSKIPVGDERIIYSFCLSSWCEAHWWLRVPYQNLSSSCRKRAVSSRTNAVRSGLDGKLPRVESLLSSDVSVPHKVNAYLIVPKSYKGHTREEWKALERRKPRRDALQDECNVTREQRWRRRSQEPEEG